MFTERGELLVTRYAMFANSKPAFSTVSTERTRFLSPLTVLAILARLDLGHATLGAALIPGINVSGQISKGKSDVFEARRAVKGGLILGRLVQQLLQTIEAEDVEAGEAGS